MNRWKLSLICISLAVMACGMPTAGMVKSPILSAAPVPIVNKDTVITTEVSTDVNMTVCNSGGLNVRPAPGDLSASIRQLTDGESVTVREKFTVTEDMGLWVELVDGGWVNARYLCEAK